MLADITLQFLLGTSKTDITSKVKPDSLSIQKTDQFDNSASFVCDKSIVAYSGQEIVIKDGSTIIFGGIIDSPGKTLIAPGVTTTQINAVNYRVRCSQRVADGKYDNVHAGSVVMVIYSYNLIDEYEGFDQGKVDDGYYHETYEFPIQPISQTFDDLAQASGFKWWVDDEKKLYFTREAKLTWAPYFVSELKTETPPATGSQIRLTDLRTPVVTEDITGYINKQYTLGSSPSGKYVHGSYVDSTEVSRMSGIYGGTGLYESVITNTNIGTNSQADDVAENYVQTYGYIPKTFNFTTTTKGYNVNQKIWIKFPILGIDTFVLFKTKAVTITCSGIEILYNISCEVYTPLLEDVKQKDSWKDSFKTIKTTETNTPQPAVIEATNIVFNPSTMTVLVNASLPTTIVTTPANASTKGITYASSDVTKCKVTSEGEIIGVAEGSVTITATVITSISTLTATLSVTIAASGGGGGGGGSSDIVSGWKLLTGYTLTQYTKNSQTYQAITFTNMPNALVPAFFETIFEGTPIRHWSPDFATEEMIEATGLIYGFYAYGQIYSCEYDDGTEPDTTTISFRIAGFSLLSTTSQIWYGDVSKLVQFPIFIPTESGLPSTTDLIYDMLGTRFRLKFPCLHFVSMSLAIKQPDTSGLNPIIDAFACLVRSNEYSTVGGLIPSTQLGFSSDSFELTYNAEDYFFVYRLFNTYYNQDVRIGCALQTGQAGDLKDMLITLVMVLQ